MLRENLKAPLFKETDIFDRDIDLNDYKDKKILIGFFRHAGCPFCNLRVHTLTKIHQEMKDQGLEMIFFFESPKRVLLRSIFHKEVSPIPLISDPDKEIYAKYGIESSGYKSAMSHITTFVQTALKAKKEGVPMHPMAAEESIKTMPAEFLVDKDLVLKKVHYSDRLVNRLDVSEIKDFAYEQSVIK